MIQVCTDNETNMKLAAHHLPGDYPKVHFQGCAIHSLDLLLQNWSKEDLAEQTVTKVKLVVNFIKHHHATLAAYTPQLAIDIA